MGREARSDSAPRHAAPVEPAARVGEPMLKQVEHQVEADPSLVPTGRSKLQVEPAVLEPEEVSALLADLQVLLTDVANEHATATEKDREKRRASTADESG